MKAHRTQNTLFIFECLLGSHCFLIPLFGLCCAIKKKNYVKKMSSAVLEGSVNELLFGRGREQRTYQRVENLFSKKKKP